MFCELMLSSSVSILDDFVPLLHEEDVELVDPFPPPLLPLLSSLLSEFQKSNKYKDYSKE